MPKLFIENRDKANPANVRIYPLDSASRIDIPESFTGMDDLGISFGISLNPRPTFECVGTVARGGGIEIIGDGEVTITGSDEVTTTTREETLEAIRNMGFRVDVILQPALPPVGPEEPTSDERILITNIKADDSNGFALAFDSATTFSSFGSEEAVEVLGPGEATVCLAPMKFVDNALPTATSKCIKLEGCFAVEINGVMVPHYFKAEDLPRYFSATNEHGVQFLSCVIKCVPSEVDVWRQEQQEIEGGWVIDYSFDDGPIHQWSQVDMSTTWYTDLFDNMVTEMFTSAAPAGVEFVGGGGGVSNFQIYQSKLLGAEGGEAEVAHKVSFHRQAQSSSALDLFDYFFGQVESGDRLDVTSCGTAEFPGY